MARRALDYGHSVVPFFFEPAASGQPRAGATTRSIPLVHAGRLRGWRPGDKLGGPLLSVAGQRPSQTVPLEAPGNDQNSRLLFANVRGRIRTSAKDQIEADYTGSRISLSNGGVPAGIEAFEGNRMAPSFVLPGGFPGESESDSFDSVQAGWTHELEEASGLGAIQVRYGYSTAHLNTSSVAGASESSIELLGGMVTGAPPLGKNPSPSAHVRASRGLGSRAALRTAALRHQIVGAGWKTFIPESLYVAGYRSDHRRWRTRVRHPVYLAGPQPRDLRSLSAYALGSGDADPFVVDRSRRSG